MENCPECKKKFTSSTPWIGGEFKGTRWDCECGKYVIEFKPKSKERQDELNKAFALKKQELKMDK